LFFSFFGFAMGVQMEGPKKEFKNQWFDGVE